MNIGKWRAVAFSAIVALFCACYVDMFSEAKNFFLTGEYTGLIARDYTMQVFIKVLIFFIPFFVIIFILQKYCQGIMHTIDQNRYLIAIVILLLAMTMNLSGSSIASWYATLNGMRSTSDLYKAGVLFGFPRTIRSDEWAVFTSFGISQQYTNFSQISNLIRGTATDVTTVYGQPAWAIVTLFRPFEWGYLLFGAEKGLSFFWVGRFLALFLVTYEFTKILTKNDKWLSATMAVIMCFSPAIQWWFSTNGLVEMIVFGQLVILLIRKYMTTESVATKVGCGLLMVLCAGGFAFTFYPAQEIPMFYLCAVLAIWQIYENRNKFHFVPQRDICIIGGSLVLLGILVAAIFHSSGAVYNAVMSTEYPGGRIITGGGLFSVLFGYVQSLFLSVDWARAYQSANESSMMFSMFPLGMILAINRIMKKKDLLLEMLIALQAWFLLFYIAPVPVFIAKITLFSYVVPGRLIVIIGIVELIMLFRSITLEKVETDDKEMKLGRTVAVAAVVAILLVAVIRNYDTGYMSGVYTLLGVLLLAVLIACLIGCLKSYRARQLLLVSAIAFIMLPGLTVNPVQSGIKSSITDQDVVVAIREIVSEDKDALWAATDVGFPLPNLPIMAGASTVNSSNVYPNLDLWAKLDPDGVYSEIYNRYSHIDIKLTSQPTSFELLGIDYYCINLNYNDLQILHPDYLLSTQGYEDIKTGAFQLSLVKSVSGLNIFKVMYNT